MNRYAYQVVSNCAENYMLQTIIARTECTALHINARPGWCAEAVTSLATVIYIELISVTLQRHEWWLISSFLHCYRHVQAVSKRSQLWLGAVQDMKPDVVIIVLMGN